jgi:ABC-type multidrug transport system fused ATPase/permease subunit
MTRDVMAAVAVIAVFLAAGSRVVPSMLRLQGAMILVRQAAGQAAPTYALARELNLDQGVTTPSHLGGIDAQELGRALGRGYPDFSPTVLVSDVWMTYPGARSGALEGVSISVPAGTSVALVGPTGAGKSTLADVILGVLNVDMGEVRIGGLSPKEAVVRWPGAIAYVPQEVVMANGTVMQNVALGLPLEAIDENLAWEALERAHLADYLRKSRQGLDTMVGEHGIKLSGGQRQRLGVARALYTRPKLLVLDEATSALDAETEKLIASTLRDLEGDVTTLTVAHRLATIRHCDLVVYMERGRVVSSGSFSEVRRTAPHFDEQARLLGL